MIVDRTVWSNR